MAKHDQRILKFLNQNADRAPTITEMMTRLNISISDISDSLASLQGQGLVSMRTNAQGIECWFPASSSHAQPAPPASGPASAQVPPVPERPAVQAVPAHAATAQMPAMGGPAPEIRPAAAVAAFATGPARAVSAPVPQPPPPRSYGLAESGLRPAGGAQTSVAVAEAPVAREPSPLPGMPPPEPGLAAQPQIPAPLYPLAPAPKGVGFLALLAGLIAAVALSAYITTRLISKEFGTASAAFVDKKALADANAALADFQDKTKSHVTALEEQVKKLNEEMTAAKAANDSLKTEVANLSKQVESASAKPRRTSRSRRR